MTTAGLGQPEREQLTPWAVASNDTQLFATDYANHRVLVWNEIPTTNNQPPDLVLGQPNWTHGACNQGAAGLSAATLCSPTGIAVTTTALLVVDRDNLRILAYQGH